MADTKISELAQILNVESTDLLEISKYISPGVYDSRHIVYSDLIKAMTAGIDNNQTGTAYTLALADSINTTVWMNNAAANVVTIPANAAVAYPVGTKIAIIMEGAGATSITGDTGVTVNGTSAGSVVINNQYQGASLTKRDTDVWIVNGDIS